MKYELIITNNSIFNGKIDISAASYRQHKNHFESVLKYSHVKINANNYTDTMSSDDRVEYYISGYTFDGLSQLLLKAFNGSLLGKVLGQALYKQNDRIGISCNDYDALLDTNYSVDGNVLPMMNGTFDFNLAVKADS